MMYAVCYYLSNVSNVWWLLLMAICIRQQCCMPELINSIIKDIGLKPFVVPEGLTVIRDPSQGQCAHHQTLHMAGHMDGGMVHNVTL